MNGQSIVLVSIGKNKKKGYPFHEKKNEAIQKQVSGLLRRSSSQ